MNEVISTAAEEVTETPAEGANEQTVAESAAEGEREQEVTEPAAEDAGQDPEERHRQAQSRRKAEREQLERELTEKIESRNRSKMDAIVKAMGRKNPYTGKIIETQAELEEYNLDCEKRKRADELAAAGLSEETLRAIIDSHPDVKAAKAAAAEMEKARQAYDRAAQEESLKDELREIGKLDPNIRTAQDLINHAKYPEIKKLVRENNHTLAEAFEIATEADRRSMQTERAAQASARAAAGKNHLVSSKSSGAPTATVNVPPAVMAGYRAQNPRITPAEAAKKYERFLNLKRF